MLSLLRMICVLFLTAASSRAVENQDDDAVSSRESALNDVPENLKGALLAALPMLQRSVSQSNVSDDCSRSLSHLAAALLKLDVSALRFLDSTGKIPPGLLEGTTSDLGAYDECLATVVRTSQGQFRGQYCSLYLKPKRSALVDRLISQLTHYPIVKDRFNVTSVYEALRNGRIHGLRLGLCVPSTCTGREVELVLSSATQFLSVTALVTACRSDEPHELNAVQLVALCVFGGLLFMLLLGTGLDTMFRWKSRSRPGLDACREAVTFKIPLCFSAISNTESLLKAPDVDRTCLKCLNGLKFFSAAWVVLGHTYSIFDPHTLGRALGIFEMTHQFLFCIIANAYPSVETFFVMSGFLLVHQLYPKLKDTKNTLHILLVAEVRRYIRITTPLMFLLGVIFLYPLAVRGPTADEWLPMKIGSCYRNWLAIPLHYNNWLTQANICCGHLWYLACDMQIFSVVLLLCFLLAKSARLGIAAMVFVTLVCNSFIAYFTHVTGIGPSRVSSGGDVSKMMKALELIHQRPYPHVGSYMAGALTGYIFLRHGSARLSKVTLCVLWACGSICCVYAVFGAFKWQKGAPPVGADVVFYNGAHRTAFAFGVSWAIYACVSGQAGIVNRLLAWDAYLPLGRLTFSVYLIHFFVVVTSVATSRERMYVYHWFMTKGFLANLVLSYVLGYLFYLLCEKPFANLENLLFARAVRWNKAGPDAKKMDAVG